MIKKTDMPAFGRNNSNGKVIRFSNCNDNNDIFSKILGKLSKLEKILKSKNCQK